MSYGLGRPAVTVRSVARAVAGAVFFGAIAGAMWLVAAAPAAAHASLEGTRVHIALKASSPKDGGAVDAAPGRLLLEFTGPVVDVGHRVAVRGPDGRDYRAGNARAAGTTLTQALKPLGPPGEYRVTFRVVAGDGHELIGGIRFTLAEPGPMAADSTAVANDGRARAGGDPGPADGGTAVAPTAPLAAVAPTSVATSLNNAPSWAPWLGGSMVMISVLGAALFGRRVTRDLD